MSRLECSKRLAALRRDAGRCRICRDVATPVALPHEPRPIFRLSSRARILIASQAPGARAHASGVPFDDASGVRLRAWLGVTPKLFYDVDRFAILPMGLCFPGHDRYGGDLPPRRECRATWHDAILAALPALEIVLMIGRFAQVYHLQRAGCGALMRPSLAETVREWRSFVDRTPPRLFPLPHPSWRNTGWLKRNPWFEADVLPQLRSTVRQLLD